MSKKYKNLHLDSIQAKQLIIIDNYKLKKNAIKKAESILKKIDSINISVKNFNEVDQSIFRNWFEVSFKNERSKIEQLQQELSKISLRHNHLLAESELSKIDMPKALVKIKNEEVILKEGTEEEKNRIENRRHFRNEYIKKQMEEDFDFLTEDFKDESQKESFKAESFFSKQDFSDIDKIDWEKINLHLKNKVSVKKDPALKKIYRTLLRRLHPDMQDNHCKENDSWKQGLWQKVLKAYEQQDKSELEKLMYMTFIRGKEFSSLSMDDIKHVELIFQKELKTLNKSIKELKQQPAWNFSIKTDYNQLHKRIKKDFQVIIQNLEYDISRLQEYHEYLEALSLTNLVKKKNKIKSKKKNSYKDRKTNPDSVYEQIPLFD